MDWVILFLMFTYAEVELLHWVLRQTSPNFELLAKTSWVFEQIKPEHA
jgi:hypothetical protein